MLLILQREHPCLKAEDFILGQDDEEDDESFQTRFFQDDKELKEMLLEEAVESVFTLGKVLQDQFAHEFNPFYVELIKYTVTPV